MDHGEGGLDSKETKRRIDGGVGRRVNDAVEVEEGRVLSVGYLDKELKGGRGVRSVVQS